jgi:two-component system OmpR family sensor kinase
MFDDVILHDLKNPLAGITGSTGLFLEGMLGPLSEEQVKYLENIDFSAKRLGLLLAELTFIADAGRSGPAVTSPFPAGELRPELAWIKKAAAKEEKTLTDGFDDKLSLRADKHLTSLVLEDLLLTAVKQVGRGGQVALDIKKDKDKTITEIVYGGEEIPAEFLPLVFEKDFRAEHEKLKTKTSPGAGFYFCKLAVEAQGGTIGIESAPGRSRVYFSLPL